MLQNQRRETSEWSCNDQGGQPSVRCKEHNMTHVTVTFSGTHEFLCRSKLNSFDDHGMYASMPNSVIKAGQAMATATVELDRYERQPASSVSVDVKQ
jgi:hypothetical protein